MSETGTDPAVADGIGSAARAGKVSIGEISRVFLLIGATSFGSTVPYLRDNLVEKKKWLSDKTFVELLSISQTLPGLNATNMAVLVGQRLRGVPGALAALINICLPGALIMLVVGLVYREYGDHVWATAALKGVAAASVGLTLATVVQLSRKSLADHADLVFLVLTVLAVNRLHLSVVVALLSVGILAVLWHRPNKGKRF